ncbi:unnamed protein product [Gongylonema pulchrum]|uniref:Secreted protein n=1 Tax=Gongylonema pulchrum TaxID=637853 RepID=A0A183E5I7_9BILA|nr:unnamed protein product [Gongylonema pulchrum]
MAAFLYLHGNTGYLTVLLPGVTTWNTVAAGHIRFHRASITATKHVTLHACMSSILRQNAQKSVTADTEDHTKLTNIMVSE